MIILAGPVILVAAVIGGVASVLANSGRAAARLAPRLSPWRRREAPGTHPID